MMKYLRKAPTLIVIGVTGYVALPIFFAERDPGPPKLSTGATATVKTSMPARSVSMRNPFQVDRPPTLTLPSTPTSTPGVSLVAGSPAGASLKSDPKKGEVPGQAAADEDRILAGMRLGGTFIDGREKLAVINNKVYARGDQLRGADGSLLPYVITDVQKDRALIRRGRRDFVIAFSNTPRTGVAKGNAPAKAAPSQGVAKADTRVGTETAANPKTPGPRGQSPAGSRDPKDLILQMLSGLGGSPAGGSSGSSSIGGLNPSTFGAGISPSMINAGLEALMGKYDNIGREDTGSIVSNPVGETTP